MSSPVPRTVSVVVNTYNRAQSLETTLRALRQLDPVGLEVVVVNGPSTDGTKEVLDRWDRWVKVGHCPERNLSMSRNIGIAMAAGDVVAFIDDDAYPDPAWLRHILDGFDDPEVAGVGGPTLDHTGVALQARYNLADRLGNAWVSTDVDEPNPTALFNAPMIDTFLYTIGTNSAFRRDRLIEIGGFDEEYEYYLDETDVCLRLMERGFVIRALDAGTVFHKFLPSAMRTPQRAVRDRFPVIKNRVYFALTHGLETHSFDDLCRSLVTFLDLSRGDVVSNLHHGLLEPADLERFDADTHTATTLGFESWKRGHRRRPCAWFDERAEPWLGFPSNAPLDGERLHVCLVSQEYPPNRVNGIGRLTHSLATALAELGHVVRVLTRGEHADRVDLEDGVWVHRLVDREHPLPPELAGLPHYLWNRAATVHDELVRINAARPVDVVHAPNWDCEAIATMRDGRFTVALGVYTPLVSVVRLDPGIFGVDDQSLEHRLAAERWTYEAADLLVASGPAVVAEVEDGYGLSLEPRRVLMVANGLPDEQGQEMPPRSTSEGLEVLFVGRLERRKGIDGLLAAIPTVLRAHPDTTFTIVGDDTITRAGSLSYRAAFEASAPPWVRERVRFTGAVPDDDRQALYRSCDIFVAPSRFESFGLVLVEAMMLGKAVIGGDCAAMRAIVEDGAGLFASADDPDALAAAISSLIGDPAARTALQSAARRRYEERYSATVMASAVAAACRELGAVAAHRGARA